MKLQAAVTQPKDKDGQVIDITQRSGGVDTTKFEIIPEGYYFALVRGLKMETYQGTFKVGGVPVPNPASADGKWTYVKITPDLELFNDNGTIINRQETTVGVLQDGRFIRPDNDATKSEIWVEAQYLLRSLGLFSKDHNGNVVLAFDSEDIKDRVVKVGTGIAAYIKGQRTVNPKTLKAMLQEQNQGQEVEFADIGFLTGQYSTDHGVELKTKNIVTAYYDVSVADAQAREWFVDDSSGAVFINEASYNAYLVSLDANHEPF